MAEEDYLSTSVSPSNSSSESSDDEIFFAMFWRKKMRVDDYVNNTVNEYTEQEFFEHFRVSRNLAEELSTEFERTEYYNDTKGGYGTISAYKHILVFLWFAGHQTASFRDVGDRFDIALSSLFRIIRRVTMFLSNKSNEIIIWPDEEEKLKIESFFHNKGFPQVIGVIDGSHVKIDTPSEDSESYFNRKHYYSIQMQVVCDHEKRIRDVFIGFPGSVHDARVFRESSLGNELPNKCGNYVILGDSAYPCTRHLLTPYKDNGHLTRVQQNYNIILSRNRYVIEHCFGILKQKFRQLYHLKLKNVRDICHFIRACCVLHNLSIDEAYIDYVVEENEPNNGEIQNRVQDDNDGPRYRDFVASQLDRYDN